MKIDRVAPEAAPMDLLLLADPSLPHILSYLPKSTVLVGTEDGESVAAAVLQFSGNDAELWNIAIVEPRQRCGLGRELLAHVIRLARESGVRRCLVGTGNSSFSAMAFYQRNGFRMSAVVRDFFEGYEPPIVENGIPCRDMILFAMDFNEIGSK